MAAHARLKKEFTEDEKCHNLMRWLKRFLSFHWSHESQTYVNIYAYFLSAEEELLVVLQYVTFISANNGLKFTIF